MTGRRRRALVILPAAGVVAGLVVAMAFFVRGFGGTDGGDYAAPAPSAAPSLEPSLAVPISVPRPTTSHRPSRYVVGAGGPTITLGTNGGSGIKIVDGRHRLVARVTSAEPIYAVGWLIPTSLDSSYGKNMHPGRSFTIDTEVSGKPAYALLWIYAGASGTPVTCTISVDGRVSSEKTTHGPYGRQVCYG